MVDYNKIIRDLVVRISCEVSEDCRCLLHNSVEKETDESSKALLKTMEENVEIACKHRQALCQSPGYLTAYIAFGDDFFIPNIDKMFRDALIEATEAGYLRPSMVDPLTRKNSNNNTGRGIPNIEFEYKSGIDYVEVIPSIKGCGVELYNKIKVFTIPEIGEHYEGIKKFVLQCVCEAGGVACLPSAIGIGIGGQFDVAAKLSRKAMSNRSWLERNEDPLIAKLEEELLHDINALHIGAGGTGGDITTLTVNIETAHTHTTLCPVAVNFHCWVARRAGIRIFKDGRVEKLSFL